MIKEINIGEQFFCIKTVKMKYDKEIVYVKGKIYKSEKRNCITNENKKIEHYWNCEEFKEHFIKVKTE